jgi:hypothetical protein
MPGQITWMLILGSFTSFMVGLDALVVATALPTLHQEFGAGLSHQPSGADGRA